MLFDLAEGFQHVGQDLHCGIELTARNVAPYAAHESMLPGGDGLDGVAPVGREAYQGGASVCRVRDEFDETRLAGIVNHALHELAAEVLCSCHLRHGQLALAAELVEHGADSHGHSHDGLISFHDASHLAVHRPERNVNVREPMGESVGVERAVHGLSMTPELSQPPNYDTLVVMTILNTRLFELADHRIGYVESPGEPARTPLVLLHGGAVDHRMWLPQFSAFPGRRIAAPDARGHGASSDATTPYRLADDVVDLLDALQIERAVLVGVSMGGGTAVDVALEHPSRVSALVVSGTGTSEIEFTDPWALDTLAAWKEAEVRGDPEAWITAFMRFTHGPEREPVDVDTAVWDLVETMVRDTLTHHVIAGEDGVPVPPTPPTPVTETWQRLNQIEVPVLALSGADDSTDHRSPGRRLADAVSIGHYREVPGSAHFPNLENAAAFNAAITEFLRNHDL
nr:alpha/beta hydrolase [Kocuria coralli]